MEEVVLDRVSKPEAVAWLAASPDQLELAKTASELLYSLLASASPSSSTGGHARKLLTKRFDAEQIWQQIDLQAAPLLPALRRRLKHLESTSADDFFSADTTLPRQPGPPESEAEPALESEPRKLPSKIKRRDNADLPAGDQQQNHGSGPQGHDEGKLRTFEDSFLKLGDMERFLDQADNEDDPGVPSGFKDTDDGSGDEVDFTAALDELEEHKGAEEPGYEDFFGASSDADAGMGNGEEIEDDSGAEDEDGDKGHDNVEGQMSSHAKRTAKLRRRLEQLEQANIDQKDWTLQGEVTAARRPKNSALEVELDFEQRSKPAPLITEEVTKSIEDIIRSRILAGEFDDVQRQAAPAPGTTKELFEIDEEKSKKGLGTIYEAEYLQKSGFATAAKSSLEEQKEEVKAAFKALCLKLDALSHFHFAPKPVIEDMVVRADVPALAMEEVAPVAVADASLLAPEEVFAGQGAIKGAGELTRENRKQERAKKKRKRRLAKETPLPGRAPGQLVGGRSPKRLKPSSGSRFGKSTNFFGGLQKAKEGNLKALDKASPKPSGRTTFKL